MAGAAVVRRALDETPNAFGDPGSRFGPVLRVPAEGGEEVLLG